MAEKDSPTRPEDETLGTNPVPRGSAPASPAGAPESRYALLGTVQGGIRIVEILARGGMGEIYIGFDEKLGRKVALKALRQDLRRDPEARERFLREARVLSQLEHPNICRIYGFIEGAEQDFLVLELLHGKTLKGLERGSLDRAGRFGVARDVAEALAAAHARGVVHRDLKPDNVMVTDDGRVKVLDFGLSRFEQDSAEETFAVARRAPSDPASAREDRAGTGSTAPTSTQLGAVLGTLGYMSPEQARGEAVSFASDLYCFGLLVQELFSGQAPFEKGLTGGELLARAALAQSLPFADENPDLQALVERLKSPAPASRPSALDALEHLRRAEARPRRRRVRILTVASLVALAMLAFAMVLLAVHASREAERASRQARDSEQVALFIEQLFDVADPAVARGKTVTARDLLDYGVERIDSELKDQPAVQARLKIRLGDIYSGLGMYDQAASLLTSALAQREKAQPPDDLAVAEALDALGNVRWLQGKLQEADGLLRRSLTLKEENLPPDDPALVETLDYLALLTMNAGRSDEAEAFLERALVIGEAKMGPSDPFVAVLHHNLGTIYYQEGRFAEAEAQLRRAVTIGESSSDPDYLEMAPTLDFLGLIATARGDATGAEGFHRRTLEIRETNLGGDHREVAISLSYLASALAAQGRSADALACLDRAEVLLVAAAGRSHPDTAGVRVEKARVLSARGDLSGACREAGEAISILEPCVAREPDNLRWSMNLAEAHLCRAGGAAPPGPEARADLERALELTSQASTPTAHLDLVALRARALLMLGREEEARPLLARLDKVAWRDEALDRLRKAGAAGASP